MKLLLRCATNAHPFAGARRLCAPRALRYQVAQGVKGARESAKPPHPKDPSALRNITSGC